MSLVYKIVFIVLFIPSLVLAHPGNLDANNCHTCYSNCTDWGLEYEEYHCTSPQIPWIGIVLSGTIPVSIAYLLVKKT